jgi:hypothetical protein
MNWPRTSAYITGTVDQELLLRNEYLAAENGILREQVEGRLLLSDSEKKTLAEIGFRLARKSLEDVANAVRPDTILGWYRKLVAQNSMVPRHVAARAGRESMQKSSNSLSAWPRKIAAGVMIGSWERWLT